VTLRRILLRNVSDELMNRRNRGVQVLVRSGNDCWNTIYDGIERERAFVRAVERRYAGQTLAQRAGVGFSRVIGRKAGSEPASAGADPIPADRSRLG
jgi:hypothetical protein